MGLGNRIVAWAIAIGLGIATLIGAISIPDPPKPNALVLMLLWINLALILIGLGSELGRRPYSLHLMHLISLFLFLGAASLLQYTAGRFGVAGPIAAVRAQVLPAVATTTLWVVGYLSAYELRRLMLQGPGRIPKARFLTRPITLPRAFLITGLGFLGLIYLAAAGLLGVGTRGAAEAAIADFSIGAGAGNLTGTFYIINYNLARALPPLALLSALLVLLRDPRSRSLALLPFVAAVGVGTLAVNNPFAASRMFFTCSLIGFSAPFFLRRFKTGWLIVASILGGLAFLPALSASRNTLDLNEFRNYFELMSPLDYLSKNSDVDSLGMTALCQKWIDRFGHRWGLQILGALFCWVPRAIWPSKPVATGGMVTEDLGFDFTNLSPPIPAEALVDFGLPGVPILAAIFGLILARLDAIYWSPGRLGIAATHRIIDAIYPFWLVCIVFFTRGDLFASVTFTIGFTVWILPLGLRLLPAGRRPSAVAAVPAGETLRAGLRTRGF